jgi:hypothetical protein
MVEEEYEIDSESDEINDDEAVRFFFFDFFSFASVYVPLSRL